MLNYAYTDATVKKCLDELQALFPASIKYAITKNRSIVVHLKLSSRAAEFEEWARPLSTALRVEVRNDKTSFGTTKGRKRGKFKGSWPLVWITPPRDFTDSDIKDYFQSLQAWEPFQAKKLQQRHENLYRKRQRPNGAM